MKKFISLLIVAVMSLSIIASCDTSKKSNKGQTSSVTENSETVDLGGSSSSSDATVSSATEDSVSSASSVSSQTSVSSVESQSESLSDSGIDDSAVQGQMSGSKYAGSFNYEDYETLTSEYNRNLFYYNELKFEVADPSVIYVSREQDPVNGGYFYAYGTSDQLMCNGLQGWRSTDLTNWEDLGPVYIPDYEDNWCYTNYWAPECIYDPVGMNIDGKTYHYFMYYNAEKWATMGKYGENALGDLGLGILYAESAAGPFYAPDNYRNLNNELLTHANAPFDFTNNGTSAYRTDSQLDGSPFIDTDGQKYLYFAGYGFSECIYGVKMKDWFSPDYSTLTMICEHNKKTVGGETIGGENNNINEGPFMYKDGNTYMMTFSTFGAHSPNYQVRLATSTNPLSGFTKVEYNNGGTVIKTGNYFNVKSAGHHSFIRVGDQLFIAYHTFKDRSSIASGRALAIDEVHIVNYNGQKIFVTNGPSYSYQPLPYVLSGYNNIASQATITGDIVSNASALTDGLVRYHTDIGYVAPETELSKNGSLTLNFSTYKNVRAIMVYLPLAFWSRFTKAKVELTYKSTGGDKTITIDNWVYDVDHHYVTQAGRVRPGGNAILEFNDLPIKQIKIDFVSPGNSKSTKLEIGEIVVLSSATNTTITAVSDAQLATPYTYINALVPVAEAHPQGEIIGSVNVDGTPFYTTRGVDVSQDNTTAKLVKTYMPRDQYGFFKGVSTVNAYFEAEFNVYATKAYLEDPWPKIGLVVRNAQACTFFYIDAAYGYTKKAVGFTQSQIGGGTWDWSNTEALADKWDIAYFGSEGWTKLAILRMGNEFYFYCNNTLMFTSSSLRGLGTSNNAACGFLAFNTGMQVRNYSCITNLSAIEAKFDELNNQQSQDPETPVEEPTTFGNNGSVTSSAQWDISTDYSPSSDLYASRKVTLSGSDGDDNYLYFKNVNANNFYAEATFKATAVYNGEAYGKYGFALFSRKADTQTKTGTYYYVDAYDGSVGYTGKSVGYVNVANDAFDWGSSPSVFSFPYDDTITLGIYRQGTLLKMLRNGEVVLTTYANLASMIYPCIFSFNIGLEVTSYRITTSKSDAKMVELYEKEIGDDGFAEARFGTLENTVGFQAVGFASNGKGWATNTNGDEARTLVTNVSGTRLFFEANVTLKGIYNNDAYPKAGIIIKTNTTEVFFAIDALPGGKDDAAYFGGNDWLTYGIRSCSGALGGHTFYDFKQALGMQYTNGESCAMSVYYNNGHIVFSVNRAPIFSLKNIGISGDVSVGLCCFNLNMEVTGAKVTVDVDALEKVTDEIGLINAERNITVDGNLSDWNGNYTGKYSTWDDAGRGFEVMAFMGTNGVYVGYHAVLDHYNNSEAEWCYNTNVELVAYPMTSTEAIQVYLSVDGQYKVASVYGITYKTRADEKVDVYFELYIPYSGIGYAGTEDRVVLLFALRPGRYEGVDDLNSAGAEWWCGDYIPYWANNGFTGYLVTKYGILK